jgi:hypothetical protein
MAWTAAAHSPACRREKYLETASAGVVIGPDLDVEAGRARGFNRWSGSFQLTL